MKTFGSPKQRQRRRQSGLTLVEILVASTLLLVIVIGLMAAFNQTQRAFRNGIKDTDVSEGARSALELIARDVQQMSASQLQSNVNFHTGLSALAGLPVAISNPTGGNLKTNVLQDMFFLSYATNWTGIGFQVLDPVRLDSGNIYGTLYRFSTNSNQLYVNEFYGASLRLPSQLAQSGQLNRVLDGVVHFRVTPLNREGVSFEVLRNQGRLPSTNVVVGSDVLNSVVYGSNYEFQEREVPAYVEIELGIVEPVILEQLKSLPPAAQRQYLQEQAGKMHIYRQQIPIRTAL